MGIRSKEQPLAAGGLGRMGAVTRSLSGISKREGPWLAQKQGLEVV